MNEEQAKALMDYTNARIGQSFASLSGDAKLMMEADAAVKKTRMTVLALATKETRIARLQCPVQCGRTVALANEASYCCPKCGLLCVPEQPIVNYCT
jgi:hypothetical protein